MCENLFKVKNIYSRQRLLRFILLPLCRFSYTVNLQHATELPNWDKSNKIFKQIVLVTSNAEEKIQKLYFYFFCNFDENTRRTHEKDPPRIRRAIKKYKSKLSELIAWQRGTWSRWWCWCTKITWNKIFLWARERRVQWKIFENHDAVQKQRKYGLPLIIFSILWFKINATLYFRAVISYQSLFSASCCFQIFPRVVCFK